MHHALQDFENTLSGRSSEPIGCVSIRRVVALIHRLEPDSIDLNFLMDLIDITFEVGECSGLETAHAMIDAATKVNS